MRKHIRTLVLLLVFAAISATGSAQQNKPAGSTIPKWVSGKGYWQIENNVKTPKSNTVTFYTNDNVLIYIEKVEGVRLNIYRRQTCKRLNKVLEAALTAFEKIHQPKNGELVKSLFRTRKRWNG